MKKLFFIASLITMFAINVNGQTKKDGTPDIRYSVNKASAQTSISTVSTTSSNSTTRPVYDGNTHTTSHGGTYVNETNTQTHKDGTYVNPEGNNVYGTHKK